MRWRWYALQARCVFVVDPATWHPISVITPTDVLRVLTQEGGATAGDAVLAAAPVTPTV